MASLACGELSHEAASKTAVASVMAIVSASLGSRPSQVGQVNRRTGTQAPQTSRVQPSAHVHPSDTNQLPDLNPPTENPMSSVPQFSATSDTPDSLTATPPVSDSSLKCSQFEYFCGEVVKDIEWRIHRDGYHVVLLKD